MFRRVKRSVLCLILLSIGFATLSACQTPQAGSNTTSPGTAQSGAAADPATQSAEADGASGNSSDNNAGGLEMVQLKPLQKGEELAVMHTTLGDITLRFFPEEAPMAVENFVTHAKAGYYDGVIFHRVIEDFMIQGGDPLGTGTGGESIWGGGFASEFSLKTRHFRGALSMAHSSLPDSNGSQFFIVQNKNLDERYKSDFSDLYDMQNEPLAQTNEGQIIYVQDIFPVEVIDTYINGGGTPHLDMVSNENGHTVFGHVVEGMDVVDAIAAVKKDANDKPLEDVVIESITFKIVE